MSAPANLTAVTVTGTYVDAQGNPATGSVTFTPTTTLLDGGTGNVILPKPVQVSLVNGVISAALFATDDVDAQPQGWAWKVDETQVVPGAQRVYYVQIPSSVAPTVSLANLATAIPTTTSFTVPSPDSIGAPTVFSVKQYGAKGNGTTDDSAAILAALAGAYAAGGGTVLFPAGTYRMDSQMFIPNNGAVSPRQPVIKLQGYGALWDGEWQGATPAIPTTTLDLRSTTGPGKVDTRGIGLLILEDINFTQTGSAADTNPFVHTTNTTLHVRGCSFMGHASLSGTTCVQDAIILGGTDTTNTAAPGTPNTGFQGYGTVIERNYFGRIRRTIYALAWANALMISQNTISSSCGATTNEAAIQFDGSGGTRSYGSYVVGNLIERTNYPYAIRLKNSGDNYLAGNSFWDFSGTSLYAHLLEGNAAFTSGNWIHASYGDAGGTLLDNTTSGPASYIHFAHGRPLGATFQVGALLTRVSPEGSTGNENSVLFQVNRPNAESTSPAVPALNLYQNGILRIGDPAYPQTNSLQILNSGGGITIDQQSFVRGSGDIQFYAGTGSTDGVRMLRGVFQDRTLATGSRPTAANAGTGACYYDTTLHKPAWSDGTNWRDASGTIV